MPGANATNESGLRRTTLAAALVILVAAVLVGLFLRLEGIQGKRQLHHDEAISYLAAAGHEGTFQVDTSGGLTGRWVPASDWKDLLHPDSVFAFQRIASDLAHHDNHPPLYFWLLHIWTSLFGFYLVAGIHLNLVITVGTALLLFALAWHVLGDPLEASLVVGAWMVSRTVLAQSLMTRHYDLFAFVTVLFVLVVFWVTRAETRPRWPWYALLVLATAAGCATHYHFVIVLIGGAVFALARLLRHDRGRLRWLTLAVLGGVALFVASHPAFLQSIQRERRAQAKGLSLPGLVSRAETVPTRLMAFFTTDRALFAAVLLLVAVAVVAVFLLKHRVRDPRVLSLLRFSSRGFSILFFLLWIAAVTVLLFITFQSPPYGLMPRYLAAVWPFMAFVPVLVGRFLGRAGVVAAGLFVLLVMAPAGYQFVTSGTNVRDPALVLDPAQRIVLDSIDRGDLPRGMLFVPDGTPVFIDGQRGLIRKARDWLPTLRPGDLYISFENGSGYVPGGREQLLALLSSRFDVVPVPGGVRGVGTIYRLEPKRLPSG